MIGLKSIPIVELFRNLFEPLSNFFYLYFSSVIGDFTKSCSTIGYESRSTIGYFLTQYKPTTICDICK